ncbi:MAG: hypothetical protein QW818_02230 [Candidatus Aenigmatarchaeota archaeon]|nr:hypothetical protein [Candidatus Aenigmarchaeota archaeon]
MAARRKAPASTLKVGEWAFLVGVLLAIVLGLFPQALAATTVTAVLVVLGIIVGLVNIVAKESHNFLLAAVALLVAGTAGYGVLPGLGNYFAAILTNISTFVSPAAVIVALKAVYELARKP